MQKYEVFLKNGFYLFSLHGNKILWMTSVLEWEVYATFKNESEARIAMDQIVNSYKECLECEIEPFRVKNNIIFLNNHEYGFTCYPK